MFCLNEFIKNIMVQAANAGGLTLTEEFHDTDILSDETAYFCVPSVKSIEFSPRIRSADGMKYAVECEFSVGLKIFGARCGFSDHEELECRISKLIGYIGLSAECVAVRLERDKIVRSDFCGRLTGGVSAVLKILLFEEGENEAGQS